MREILFRAKRVDNGEWVYGDFNRYYRNNDLFIGESAFSMHRVYEKTVGQYIGLTDKNGTKIFEGDIVKFRSNVYQIRYECGSFVLLDKSGDMISKIGGINDYCYPLMILYIECCWQDNWADDMEVIGNIQDNPDLL